MSLPSRMGDPHGDLQFSIGEKRERWLCGGRAQKSKREQCFTHNPPTLPPLTPADGTAFEIYAADIVFAADGTARVTDVTPAATTRLGSDFNIYAKPSNVTGAAACDETNISVLRSGLELALRRRERALARGASACASGGRAPGAPRAWAAAGDACSSAPVAEWEAATADALGWVSLGVAADATAPASLVDDARAAVEGKTTPPPKRAVTSRDPEAVRQAAEALVAAVGADNIRMN